MQRCLAHLMSASLLLGAVPKALGSPHFPMSVTELAPCPEVHEPFTDDVLTLPLHTWGHTWLSQRCLTPTQNSLHSHQRV